MLDLTGYKLTFDDEFNTRSISQAAGSTTWGDIRSQWRFDANSDIGFGHSSFVDSASGYDPFKVSNGALTITAVPDKTTSGYPGSWESGMITTQGNFSQTYGYFEIRADFSAMKGAWDAFWLLPDKPAANPNNLPGWQELDVVEHYGDNDKGVYSTIHTTDQTPNIPWQQNRQVYSELANSPGYHTYGMDWQKDKISFYVDGQFVGSQATPGDMTGPMYLVANLATQSDADAAGKPISSSIDYIRAYSKSANAVAVTQGTVSAPDGADPGLYGATSANSHTLEAFGATRLDQVGSGFFLNDSTGSGPSFKSGGSAVTTGQFGGWTPIGAEKTATGYEVAWKMAGADLYTVWNTDANGNYASDIGTVSGSDPSLLRLEKSFAQDLNNDGQIGVVPKTIEAFGATRLDQVGNGFFLNDSTGSGPSFKSGGSTVTTGQFGGWTPIGAEKTATGYEVAWKMAGADLYTVWNTDANGNYASDIGTVSGSDPSLLRLEKSFAQDLNNDGQIGVVPKTIEAFGATRLDQVGSGFFLNDSTGSGPSFKSGGSAVTTGQFGGWTPIGAEKTATGYEVAWKMAGADLYTVWNTDANGNYASDIGTVSGSDPSLLRLEKSFAQDLNNDGQIGVVPKTIEAFGATRLDQVGNGFFLNDSTGSGPSFKSGGSAVTTGQFGGWTPIGAEKTATGYEVAWKMAGADLYTVWNTDANGNYASDIGTVSGSDPSLLRLEKSFAQDLNNDGQIGVASIPNAIDVGATGTGKFVASAGVDNFVFHANFGKDVISGFDVKQDGLWFDHTVFSSPADILSHATDVNGSVTIVLDANNSVTLQGVTKAQLTASDFHLV